MSLDNLIIDGDFPTIVLWFATYCFLGWIWESSYRSWHERKIINSGFLAGPVIPIYGFGALLYIGLMHLTLNPIILFFTGGILACILEYITSVVLEKVFHARWWDYSDEKLNIHGRVCLLGFCAFAFFAVILPYLQLLAGWSINLLNQNWKWIIAIVFLVLILFDTFRTAKGLLKFNETLKKYQKQLERHTAPIRQYAHELLTKQQSRIMTDFPKFRSIMYPEAFKKIRKLYNESRAKIEKNRYKPQKVKNNKKTGAHS